MAATKVDPKTKVYVPDTNVLINDSDAHKKFHEHTVVISLTVVEELDGLKKDESVGYIARKVNASLKQLINGSKPGEPVALKGGGCLIFDDGSLPDANIKKKYSQLNLSKPDNRIVMTALKYKHDSRFSNRVIIVSNDYNVQVKAHMFGLASEEYKAGSYEDDEIDLIYREPPAINLTVQQEAAFYEKGASFRKNIGPTKVAFVRFGKKEKRVPAVISGKKAYYANDDILGKQDYFIPRNDEQDLAYRLALTNEAKVLVLTGSAGTGKSLISLSAALYHQNDRKGIIRIIRPTDQAGEKLGYLPGHLDDKMGPYKEAIENSYDVISQTTQKTLPTFDTVCHEGGKLRLKPINYDVGTTYRGFVILDEGQNLTVDQMKLFLTRIGKNTKVIINGDVSQISEGSYLNRRSCGLTHLLNKLKEESFLYHVHLVKGERSEIATAAAQLL